MTGRGIRQPASRPRTATATGRVPRIGLAKGPIQCALLTSTKRCRTVRTNGGWLALQQSVLPYLLLHHSQVWHDASLSKFAVVRGAGAPGHAAGTRRNKEDSDAVEVGSTHRPPISAHRRRATSLRSAGAARKGGTRAHLEVAVGPIRVSQRVGEGVSREGRNRNADLEVAPSPLSQWPS